MRTLLSIITVAALVCCAASTRADTVLSLSVVQSSPFLYEVKATLSGVPASGLSYLSTGVTYDATDFVVTNGGWISSGPVVPSDPLAFLADSNTSGRVDVSFDSLFASGPIISDGVFFSFSVTGSHS